MSIAENENIKITNHDKKETIWSYLFQEAY